ncbi:predicted protein [Botrytis cinerea T4]|uniref:Uncharacterized protein n=1 Tax=Botryotinia fuckeliana (strain T4) TaxID=999810 RepID=G2YDX4_BOTF4|nr:predicted protein [Botrytis cinerea T4]
MSCALGDFGEDIGPGTRYKFAIDIVHMLAINQNIARKYGGAW